MSSLLAVSLPPKVFFTTSFRRQKVFGPLVVCLLLLSSISANPQRVGLPSAGTAVLVSIALTPVNPSVVAGMSQQFKATGTFTGGISRDVTLSVTWTSSKPTVASISSTGSTRGLATAIVAGITTIKATHGTIKGTTTLTVTTPGPSLISITVSPGAAAITMGNQQQFTATGNYSDGTAQDVTETALWSSSAPNVASISTTGLASTVATGQTNIAAARGTITGSTTLIVSQQTHVYVAFPPPDGVNNTHFMSSVMTQPSIEGVVVPVQWATIETGTPGPGTCSPVATDICQQDSFGWTHTYDWTASDALNAQWFAAQSATKKVNIILFGMTGASTICATSNSCFNRDTPYYVTTSSWAAHTASNMQDVLNGSKDGCSTYVGAATSSMRRDSNGLVTVTEVGHGYLDGDIVWVGGSAPANYNIAQEKISNVRVVSNTLTITAPNSLPPGTRVIFRTLRNATFLNGKTVTILTSSSTQFTANFSHANYGPTADGGGTASPQGVIVQNATADTFQYQSGVLTAGTATIPGTVISAQQSWNVPYEAPYKAAWESFIAAAIAHFNASPNLSQISYMRIGRSVGGEAYPYCAATLESLPGLNAYTKSGWLAYYEEIGDFIQSQAPRMMILDPLNEADLPVDPSYGTAEAEIAVAHHNAAGLVNAFGAQGLRANDVANYAKFPAAYCASDWCGSFDTYYESEPNLELQQRDLSDPLGLTGSLTGDLRPLLPFAVQRHATILELYALDALLAFDPNYCVLTVPDTGVCADGSVSIAPTDQPPTHLPIQNQYPYFQAVGQPGQQGATGDGSYAAAVKRASGAH
jgi:Big-like domain-containing protein